MARLTTRTITAVKADSSRDVFLWDEDLHGFGLRVFPSGVKSYVVQYRNAEGRTRRMTIDKVGTLTPEEARQKARERLAEVVKGSDPAQDRVDRRTGITVKELADRFENEHIEAHCKPGTRPGYRSLISDVIIPDLGTKKVSEITRADVALFHHGRRSTPVRANRALLLLSKMMNLAEVWGIRPEGSNPTRHVRKYRVELELTRFR